MDVANGGGAAEADGVAAAAGAFVVVVAALPLGVAGGEAGSGTAAGDCLRSASTSVRTVWDGTTTRPINSSLPTESQSYTSSSICGFRAAGIFRNTTLSFQTGDRLFFTTCVLNV